jgi:hypothetical protein
MLRILSIVTVWVCFLAPYPPLSPRPPKRPDRIFRRDRVRPRLPPKSSSVPSRSLLGGVFSYQRTKTAGLTLDAMDIANVAEHADKGKRSCASCAAG